MYTAFVCDWFAFCVLLYSFKIEVEVELKILMFEGVVYFD
jgi:hypothetical protein